MTKAAMAVERQVDDALLRMAYARLRSSVLMTVAVTLLFVGLIWGYMPDGTQVYWIGALLAVSGLRFSLWLAFRRYGGIRNGLPWQAWFEWGSLAAGLSWSLGPMLSTSPAHLAAAALMSLTVLSVSAVAVVALSNQQRAMMWFLAAAMLPTAISLAMTADPVQLVAAAIVFVAMVLLMIVGRTTSQATRDLLHTDIRLAHSVDETRAARERAEAASMAKTRFLATMSHELRTPLNAVIGAAQLLRADPADPAQREYLVDAVERGGANLLSLIENVLDLARIEAGEIQLRRADFDLVACVEAAMAGAALSAAAKGLKVASVIDPTLAVQRHGDEARVRQILMNLLGNAVKFTVAGEVVVRVGRGSGPDEVCFRVLDSGVGISAASLPTIFDPFRQGEEGSNRRYGGSGLGLTIVRQLATAMGGTVEAESEPGRGSCFTLQVPLAEVATTPTSRLGFSVLLVAPDDAGAEGLCAQFERLGCTVSHCAPASLDPHLVDFPASGWIVVDLDDEAAAQALIGLRAKVPLRQVLGLAAAGGMRNAEALDIRRLLKPVSLAALRKATDRSIAAVRPMSAAQGASESGMPQHVLVVEDDRLNQAIVSGLLRHGGYRVSIADDGASALRQLTNEAFDAVLMDWQMPDMDGIEVTRRMRQGEAGAAARSVPVIALTANAFAEDRETCLAAGMNDFLTKPVRGDVLLAAMQRWVTPRADQQVAGEVSR